MPKRIVGTLGSALLVLSGIAVGTATPALAASESVQVSTFDVGPMSGSASSTFNAGAYASNYTWAEVDFPVSTYNAANWGSASASTCTAYGVQLLINGVATPISNNNCQTGTGIDPGPINVAYLYVQSANGVVPNVGDVVTVTWGSNFVSNLSTGPNPMIVWNIVPPSVTNLVTPTSTGGSSVNDQSPAPWLQSIGRQAGQDCPAGWNPSWAQWAVASTGGWVCNRGVYWTPSGIEQNSSMGWGEWQADQSQSWDGH